jgi:hypothetical protein
MEFSKNEYISLAEKFCKSYNRRNRSAYHFLDIDEKNNSNYDFRIINGGSILKIQCKIAIAEEPKDFINLQNMMKGKKYENKKSYKLIHESDRFRYAIEHILLNNKKKFAYSDCILLVIFTDFPFGNSLNEGYYLKEMNKTANLSKNNFLEIWISNEPGHSEKYSRCFKIA